MILNILREIYKLNPKEDRMLDNDSINWYNVISYTTTSYIASRYARSIALSPKEFILVVSKDDTISIYYKKILLALKLLNGLGLLDYDELDDLLFELKNAAITNASYTDYSGLYIFNDGSVLRKL